MKAKNILLALSLVLASSFASHAQVGIGTSSPNASAALDINSTTKGLLPPRMTAAQRDVIGTLAQGLMVYCTNCGANGEAQIYNGTAWVNLVGGIASAELACGYTVTFTYNGASVTYGTVTGANSKCWLDRNLGATQVAVSSTHSDSYGDLYQWGRGADGHQIRTSGTTSTLSTTDQPGNDNFILAPNSPNDWRNPQNAGLWQGVNGVNNPCPSGFRIPTEAEWNAERLSWSANTSAGAFASPLRLPMAGRRVYTDGSHANVGTTGDYWSSTVSGSFSLNLNFGTSFATIGMYSRATGFSIRCIKD